MSTSDITNHLGQLRVYGAGGAGLNLACRYNDLPDNPTPGYAEVRPVYIDTSRSNLTADHNPDYFYCLEDVDGSGKVRRENHQAISKSIRQILQEFKPLDFNVVIFSASGGSGSVIAPLLVGELLARKLPVIAMVVGSDESTITAQNTMNTLKSLESISKKAGCPIVIQYEHNGSDIKRSEVDTCFLKAIASLSVLTSKQNAELDSQDILNWVHFHRATKVEPGLALLNICRSNEALSEVDDPVSIASLYASPDEDTAEVTPDYYCAGYPREEAVKDHLPVHFALTVNGLDQISKRLTNHLDQLDEHHRARVAPESLLSANDVIEDDGLIL